MFEIVFLEFNRGVDIRISSGFAKFCSTRGEDNRTVCFGDEEQNNKSYASQDESYPERPAPGYCRDIG